MRFSTSFSAVASVLATISLVNAHFNITYPPVRGPFNEDNEPNFCDSYTDAGARNQFPLTDGYIAFITSHPSWTAGVMISTALNPTTIVDFRNSTGGDQLAVQYFQAGGTSGCIKLELGALGLSGVSDGANVTLQMAFNGGDGTLYQCTDLTLSSSFKVPDTITQECSNQTLNTVPSSSGSPSSTGSSAGPSGTGSGSGSTGGAVEQRSVGIVSVLAVAAIGALLV